MAQRVNVVLADDIDGNDASETVSFALDCVDYEIDLSDQHASDLREALALYIGHGRRTGGRRRSGRKSSASAATAADGGPSAAALRWIVERTGRRPRSSGACG